MIRACTAVCVPMGVPLYVVTCVVQVVLLVGSELIRSNVDRWFNAPMEEIVASANRMASDYYSERQLLTSGTAARLAQSSRVSPGTILTACAVSQKNTWPPPVIPEALCIAHWGYIHPILLSQSAMSLRATVFTGENVLAAFDTRSEFHEARPGFHRRKYPGSRE